MDGGPRYAGIRRCNFQESNAAPIPVAPTPVPESASQWAPVSETVAKDDDARNEGWGEPIFVPAAERRELGKNSPWSRYFARALDLTITSYAAGFGVAFALIYLSPDLYRALISQQSQVQSIILLPVAMIINGIIAGIFGTTLGKFIMALRLTYLNGRLGFFGQIGRELQVWVKGLGFGIPIVTIFTSVAQYRRVTQGMPASYDEGSVLVKQKDIPGWRRAIGMLFCAAVFFGGVAWSLWPETTGSYLAPTAISQAPVKWTNPISGRVTTLPAG